MDFLDKLVLPQSLEHMALLHYMAIVVLFLFVPFFSIVLGGSILSLYFKRKGKKDENGFYARFSKEVIELTTFTKGAGVALGIVPLFALILIYSQLLHNLKLVTISFFVVALILIPIGLVFIYTYRYSWIFKSLFSSVKLEERENEYSDFANNIARVNRKSSYWGLIFLLVGSYFFIGGLNLAMNPSDWDATGILYLFTSFSVFIKWIHFLTAALSLTGSFLLFIYFFWEGGKEIDDTGYKEFIKKTGLSVTLIFALFQPLFLLINLVALPSLALSSSVFGFAVISLFAVFWVFHLLYAMLKNSELRYSGFVFLLLVVSSLALIISEQASFRNVTKKQALVLAVDYDVALKELKGEQKGIEAISGADIFNGRCSACHRFDKKLVGPPYKETLPKYKGDVEKVAAFVLNPTKINPAYPPMPNQGLKPAEARAIAKYILEEVKKY
ncbi:MAG: c-type cytochrome [Ignavibacteriaceae bacterium]|jgi:cytochrome c